MFDKNAFNTTFDKAVKALAKSEKATRQELMVLSRSVLEAVHATEDIGYVNRVLDVLTPINRKVAVHYFATFTGFRQDEGTFTKKDKKNYEECKAAAAVFLQDPHNNIWTWAEQNMQVEPKKFDLADITKWMTRTIKKAGENNISQADVLRALFKGGVEADALIAAMQEIEGLTVKVDEPALAQ